VCVCVYVCVYWCVCVCVCVCVFMCVLQRGSVVFRSVSKGALTTEQREADNSKQGEADDSTTPTVKLFKDACGKFQVTCGKEDDTKS
jgi:hypothetical protein